MSEPTTRKHVEIPPEEYVVNGAKIICDCSKNGVSQDFTVPENRHFSAGDVDNALVGVRSDVKAGVSSEVQPNSEINVYTHHSGLNPLNFGTCSKTDSKCVPWFLPAWFNTSTNVSICDPHSAEIKQLLDEYYTQLEMAKKDMNAALNLMSESERGAVSEPTVANSSTEYAWAKDVGLDDSQINALSAIERMIKLYYIVTKAAEFPPELTKASEAAKLAKKALEEIKKQIIKPVEDPLLTTESVLVCRNGGVVSFADSGQERARQNAERVAFSKALSKALEAIEWYDYEAHGWKVFVRPQINVNQKFKNSIGHLGIDYEHNGNWMLHPICNGVIKFADNNDPDNKGNGNIVVITHTIKLETGQEYIFHSHYSHMLENPRSKLKDAKYVNIDTELGLAGDTGYSKGRHLHLGIYMGFGSSDTNSPYGYLSNARSGAVDTSVEQCNDIYMDTSVSQYGKRYRHWNYQEVLRTKGRCIIENYVK